MAVLKYFDTSDSTWKYIAASTTANFTSWKKTMSGGETSVSGTDDNAVTLSYTVGLEQVFINGVLQVRGTDYVATTGTSITGLTALVASDIVTVVCYAPFNVANTIAPTIVDAKGDLIVATAADTVGRLAVGANDLVLTAASGETTGVKWAQPKVVQVVTASTTTGASSTSTTYADTNLTASITPTSASNKILVFVNQSGLYKSSGNTETAMDIKLVRGSTDLITFVTETPYSGTSLQLTVSSGSTVYLDSPATTSSTTYKTQFKSRVSGQSVTVQSSSAASTICLMEVTP